MGATGKTYLKTYRLTRAVYWHYKQWREAGAIVQLMSVLHEQVREQVKKKAKWTTLIIIDFGCAEKHVQCECGFEGILLLQGNEWDQTASGSRYLGVSLLHTLYKR